MILTNVRLVPELASGMRTEHGTVTIEAGKITDVSEKVSDDPQAVDCGGMTLLPGLIDMHTHMTVLHQVGYAEIHSDMRLLTAAAKHATQYLDYGFTTIRDCGSIHRVANEVRNMVQAGILEAPDIIACGRSIMPTEGPENHLLAQRVHFADGAEEMRKAVRVEIGEGADFIKIFASGAAANPSGVPAECIMTEEELVTAVETAKRKGRYVAAHCHSDDAIRVCLLHGVHSIEHATLISDETLRLAEKKKDEVFLIPTLAVMYVGDGPNKAYWESRLGPMFRHCTAQMAKAYQAGMKLGFGTDCCAGDYCYENGIEFKYRKENCGMKDLDILLQATKYNAEIAGISDRVGEIRRGLDADLILADGKPDEDISVMYRKPEKVWKKGKLVRG